MTTHDAEYEKKVLRDLLEQLDKPDETLRKQTAMRRTITGLGYAGVLAGFFLGLNALLHPFAVGLICAASGVAIGFGLFLHFAQKQWPVTKRHVDVESVRKRLKELEARQSNEPRA